MTAIETIKQYIENNLGYCKPSREEIKRFYIDCFINCFGDDYSVTLPTNKMVIDALVAAQCKILKI